MWARLIGCAPCCAPPIEEFCPGAELLLTPGGNSIHSAYNRLLVQAGRVPNLEALVLLHEDVVVRDPALPRKLRNTFGDPSIGLAGVVGARRPTSLRWHDRDECYGHVEDSRFRIEWRSRDADVDVVDGLFMALSPWAVEHLRFDTTTYSGFHGYDADLSLAVRSKGFRVVVRDFDILHVTKGGYGRTDQFLKADRAWRAKWARSPFVGSRTRTWDTHRPLRDVMDRGDPLGAAVLEARLRGRARVGRTAPSHSDTSVGGKEVLTEHLRRARA